MPKTLEELIEEFHETYKNPVNVDLTLHGLTTRYNAKDDLESFIRHVWSSALEWGAENMPHLKGYAISGNNHEGVSFSSLNKEWDLAVNTCRSILLEEANKAKEVK